jgi:hypothetical protein
MQTTTHFVTQTQQHNENEQQILRDLPGISNFFSELKDKSYVPLNGCVFDHILYNPLLKPLEKLYYLLADSLCIINANYGNDRNVALASEQWALKLNCSRSQIFAMQKSLKEKGYLVVDKNQNNKGQNNKNVISTTLPDGVFEELSKNTAWQTGKYLPYEETSGCKRGYLDSTKLFIRLNYRLLAAVLANSDLSATCKILWLELYGKCLKNNNLTDNCFSLTSSYEDLSAENLIGLKYLSKTLCKLQKTGFIEKSHFFVLSDNYRGARQDKSLWCITLKVPECIRAKFVESSDKSRASTKKNNDSSKYEELVSEYNNNKAIVDSSSSDRPLLKTKQLLNKELKLNKDKNRSTRDDQIIQFNSRAKRESNKEKSNFLKNNPSLRKANYPNSKITQPLQAKQSGQPSKVTKFRQIKFENPKDLKDFYPISKEDCSILQSKSGRDFSLNAMNEILADMAKRLSDRFFRSKDAFMSYMSKVFSNEMRNPIKINNESFKIKNNLTAEELDFKEQEKFLSKIEYSLYVSPECHLKKKLACVLEPSKSYELLRAYRSASLEESVFTISLDKHVELSKAEKEIILKQVKATHESMNLELGEFDLVEKLEIKMPDAKKPPTTRAAMNKERINTLVKSDIPAFENNIWGRLRKSAMEFYNGASDVWLSKLEAKIDEDNKEIILKATSGFYKSWVKNNYFQYVEKFCTAYEYEVTLE